MNDEDVRHEDVRQEIVEVKRLFEKQKAAQESTAAEQAAETQEQMRIMTELQGKKEQGGQTQEASGTGDEERDPSASPTRREDPSSTSEGVVSVEVGSREHQPGESGQGRDYGLTGEPTRTPIWSSAIHGEAKDGTPGPERPRNFSGITITVDGVCKILPFRQSVHVGSER